MSNQYENLFLQIIDSETPDPTIVINHISHMSRVRAALSRLKKQHDDMAKFLDEPTLESFRFNYLSDPKDNSKITISLIEKKVTEFKIL